MLDQDFIIQNAKFANTIIEVLQEIDSTNLYLKKNLNCPRICFAEMQTKGRGRMGRAWHSPFGQNIYMSYAYHFKQDINELSGLSLVIAMAMLNAIKQIGIDAPIMLKWPNDGIYKGQKLMGNLIQMQGEAAIIGLGINVNMMECESDDITQDWTSLKKITGKEIDRNLLCVALIDNLNTSLQRFCHYGLADFKSQWQQLDYLYNQTIKLNDGEFSGIAKGINEQGNLLLELANGEIKAFAAGETSICK